MFVPCGPELRADKRSGAGDVQRQHRYHLLDCVDLGARYQWTAVALVALWTASGVQPDLAADAAVGRRQHAEWYDEDGHTVPEAQTTALRFVCINPLNMKRRLLYLKTQFVPHSKHFSSRL